MNLLLASQAQQNLMPRTEPSAPSNTDAAQTIHVQALALATMYYNRSGSIIACQGDKDGYMPRLAHPGPLRPKPQVEFNCIFEAFPLHVSLVGGGICESHDERLLGKALALSKG